MNPATSGNDAAAEPIWHLALARHWADAVAAGRYEWSTLGATLEQQGYIHASTAEQLPAVAAFLYADVREPLVLLQIDVARLEDLGSSVRWEDVPGADAPFPHVYGPVPVEAVVSATPWRLGDPVRA